MILLPRKGGKFFVPAFQARVHTSESKIIQFEQFRARVIPNQQQDSVQ